MSNADIVPMPSPAKPKAWIKTGYANLYRYGPSGTYYCRAKVCGKPVRTGLKTKDLKTAKNKLDRLLASERKRIGKLPEVTGEWLFQGLADDWQQEIEQNPDLKPRAKQYRLETLKAIRANTDGIDSMPPAHFTKEWCELWAKKFRKKYSGTRFNGCLQTLRAILETAVDRGLLADNPLKDIGHVEVKRKPIILPTRKQFDLILKHLKALPSRKDAYNAVRFMVYAGPRISAARQVMPEHIDFKRGEIIIPPVKYQDEPIRVPMMGEMRQVCKDLLKDYPGEGPLIPIKDPRKALRTVCHNLKIPRVTTKTLRHVFTTTCIESGVDVRTIAQWRGDKDNGAMLLKTYAHLRNEHSQMMAKRVRF
jgi:integrase